MSTGLYKYFAAAGKPPWEPIDPIIPADVFEREWGRPEPGAMPRALRLRPSHAGLPVGFMFSRERGVPNFRVLDTRNVQRCAELKLCGLCGQRLGAEVAVLGGPLTAHNRVTSDPPFHEACARYAIGVCPYLLGRTDYARSTQAKEAAGELAPWQRASVPVPKMALLISTGYAYRRSYVGGVHTYTRLFELEPWLRGEWYDRTPHEPATG